MIVGEFFSQQPTLFCNHIKDIVVQNRMVFPNQNLKSNLKKNGRMRSSSKENNRAISGKMFELHNRLHHAFNLALNRYNDDPGRKWQFTDIETQILVVRSIDAFLDCMTTDTLEHPLVKDSVADMVEALGSIIQLKNEAVLSLALRVAPKMVRNLLKLPSHLLDLVRPLSSLLSSHQLQVSVSCGTALNLIVSNLSSKNENQVWKILDETNTVVHLVSNICDFSSGNKPIQYFEEMASLLSKIMWRWPPSRFCVWNDDKLMKVLEVIILNPDCPLKVAVLELYSAIALCGNGARKLLENGEVLINMMVHCMNNSNSHSVQIEGFKLAQCLSINEQARLQMMKMCCEPIIKAIICVMSSLSIHSGKVARNQLFLSMEACRLALITRWPGEHHNYFWRLGVDNVLVNLLLNNFHKFKQSQHFLSVKEQIVIAQEGLNANFLVLRPFIWDILGWLAAHCNEDFNPEMYGNQLCINILMTCACSAFVDSMHKTCQLHQNDIDYMFKSEPAIRSVLMMINSPCKYIASQVRSILDEVLRLEVKSKEYLKYLLDNLNVMSSGNAFGFPDRRQTVINLMNLACYSGLPQYRKHVIKHQGIKTLLGCIRWCLHNHVHVRRSIMAPHLLNIFHERTCCRAYAEYWEDEDMLLLFGLWGLAELIHHSGCVKSHSDIFASQKDLNETQLISELQKIYIDVSTPGARWYAAYILSYFGYYGFPCKFGKRIGKVLNEKEYADLELILKNEESISVHGIILKVRCPSLLPPEQSAHSEEERHEIEKSERLRKEVRLSARVDRQALSKVLDFVYLGYLEAGVDIVMKLKTIAKRCNLQFLLQMLSRRSAKWGTPIPRFDLTYALGPAGHKFSYSKTIKVPVSWEALVKLCNWFYSGELPKPISGCLWNNLDSEEKVHEVQPYVELCWLADYWLLENIHEECSKVIISCLDSARQLSFKVIQIADRLSQWKLVEVAANYLASSYPRLRDSGALEQLDERLINIVRDAFVQLSQDPN
ncbi:BTB/POZ domain-containing protein At1g04390 isoform X2 [Cornus florida]|uniref:BTB/POZ domain-containing protein At1g04390 isoform X2 n=1 Tax=Cornus florida TaxID=4283 RepID=UPI0028A00580|nr:BTB/POZ domain-containing protein At1g04390 isoform X2 [Cornus florida]